jgi:hypothetical protein
VCHFYSTYFGNKAGHVFKPFNIPIIFRYSVGMQFDAVENKIGYIVRQSLIIITVLFSLVILGKSQLESILTQLVIHRAIVRIIIRFILIHISDICKVRPFLI